MGLFLLAENKSFGPQILSQLWWNFYLKKTDLVLYQTMTVFFTLINQKILNSFKFELLDFEHWTSADGFNLFESHKK